jgi:hypothetical protein
MFLRTVAISCIAQPGRVVAIQLHVRTPYSSARIFGATHPRDTSPPSSPARHHCTPALTDSAPCPCSRYETSQCWRTWIMARRLSPTRSSRPTVKPRLSPQTSPRTAHAIQLYTAKPQCIQVWGAGLGIGSSHQPSEVKHLHRFATPDLPDPNPGGVGYRGTSLMRGTPLIGPYRRTIPRVLWWSQGGGLFLMSELPLYRRPLVPKRQNSDLVQYCQLCGKVAEMTLGSDFTHTIVNLSISQLPVAVRKSTEPDQQNLSDLISHNLSIKWFQKELNGFRQ